MNNPGGFASASAGRPQEQVSKKYAANIHDVAKALPGADQFQPDTFIALVAIITNTFDGAAIVRAVLPQPDLEGKRIALLASLIGGAP